MPGITFGKGIKHWLSAIVGPLEGEQYVKMWTFRSIFSIATLKKVFTGRLDNATLVGPVGFEPTTNRL